MHCLFQRSSSHFVLRISMKRLCSHFYQTLSFKLMRHKCDFIILSRREIVSDFFPRFETWSFLFRARSIDQKKIIISLVTTDCSRADFGETKRRANVPRYRGINLSFRSHAELSMKLEKFRKNPWKRLRMDVSK